ncbi:MAG: ABC transporter ATP-binding protein [Actinobacteria bacterium]|nr:ABC transporter ATP-binding protein [Actinomycetota bacterium]
MLEVRELRHSYGDIDVLVVDALRVDDGAFVSIVGPSGCGKSTLLRIIAGLVAPTAGTIHIDDAPLPTTPGFAGFMPQHDRLLPWRTVRENAVLAADIDGVDRSVSSARADALFERFGLSGFEDAWPRALSGGMRQRVALLRTFLAERDLLLLDEPFGALDAITRRRMHGWLQEVLEADPRSVVFVTHDVDEALVLSDHVFVMSERPGRIVGAIEVPEPRPRPPGIVTSAEFVERKAQVLALLESSDG